MSQVPAEHKAKVGVLAVPGNGVFAGCQQYDYCKADGCGVMLGAPGDDLSEQLCRDCKAALRACIEKAIRDGLN